MKGRVLAVDDEHSIRVALSMSFEDDGWECRTAASAEDALDVLRRESFDVLFFDKNLPAMSGVELLARVRAENHDVPVVIMTAFASAGSAKESLNLGVDRYVEKPFKDVFELPRLAEEFVATGRRRWIPDPNVFSGTSPQRSPNPDVVRALRVVIAAREHAVMEDIARRLQPLGVKIACAESEEEAAGAAASDPDLVIIDAESWPNDALSLLERVRKRASDASLVVLVRDDPSLEAMKRMISIGIAGLVPRRFDDSLSNRLEEIVRTVRLR